MGNNPSRNPFKRARLGLDRPSAEVDAYKARSVWGAWWDLEPETRARYFNGAEIRLVQRYGSRMDKIASMVEPPATPAELHCMKSAGATSRRGTRPSACGYACNLSAIRAIDRTRGAGAEALEYELGPLQQENMAPRRDLRDAEAAAMESINEH